MPLRILIIALIVIVVAAFVGTETVRFNEKAVRATYSEGKFWQNPAITDEAVRALQAEEVFMAESGLLKGKVDYDSWIDRSYYDAAQKKLAGN